MTLTLAVDPVGKPRMTQRDRWKKRPVVLAYFAYRDEIKKQAEEWVPPDYGLKILFVIPMPASWSGVKKAKMLGELHQQKPDIDNLLKAFFDCFGEDCHIANVQATKRWGKTGEIRIGVKR